MLYNNTEALNFISYDGARDRDHDHDCDNNDNDDNDNDDHNRHCTEAMDVDKIDATTNTTNAVLGDTANHAMDMDYIDTEAIDAGRQVLLPVGCNNGGFKAMYIYIEGKAVNRPRLKQLCKLFELQCTGTKAVLRGRLRAFSADRMAWEQLKPSTYRAHLGPQAVKALAPASTKKSSAKKSVLRREMLFNLADAQPSMVGSSLLSTAAPTRRFNQERHEQLLAFVSKIGKKYPYYPKDTRMEMATARLKAEAGKPATAELKEGIDAANEALQKLLLRASSNEPNTAAQSVAPSVSEATMAPADAEDNLDTAHGDLRGNFPINIPALVDTSAPASTTVPVPCKTYSLNMANNFVLTFTEDDIPPSPASYFANNFELLNAMWDEDSRYWRNYSHLVIKGYHIPIVYWKKVYSPRAGGVAKKQWERLKGKHFQCRILVQALRSCASLNEFYSKNVDEDGEPLTYTKTLAHLAKLRVQRINDLAQAAKAEYGSNFDKEFSYRRGKKYVTKTRPSDIAKHYCRLKNFEYIDGDDEDNDS
ncbi:hypothetical protein BJ912DRAFT_911648 [Pholiota molesta]|nr:hypothetical protein BJ912DRAFT_911648 [Pholiota molesta]